MLEPASLVADRASEGPSLDFKACLPGRADRDRHEFLKDVCAFANANGGVIYYGIGEADGSANELQPIEDEGFDEAVRRLGQVLDSGVEPRLASVEFQKFALEVGYVLGVRVAPSYARPHRYHFNGHSRFVVRNNTHVSDMTYDRLRSAFNWTGALRQRADALWADKIERALDRTTWRPLANGPICLIQFLPLPSLDVSQLIDIGSAYEGYSRFIFPDWGASATFNLDGLVIHLGDISGDVRSFVQLNRNGSIDFYRSGSALYRDEKIIPSQTVAEFVRNAIYKAVSFAADKEIPGPFVINAALLDVEGYRFGLESRLIFFNPLLADRQNLVFPSTYVENLFEADAERISRSILDLMWQSFGVGACTLYNTEGVWTPR